jgi:SAM-dependent methyltransferase
MTFWDTQYAVPGYKYGTSPNAFLQDQAVLLGAASDVLVPGDGEGRNGVWLATQGHRVTAVDSSAVGFEKAHRLAGELQTALTTIVADLTVWVPPASVDAVVLVYVHFTPAERAAIHARLLQALRVDGVLILEAFHPDQIGRTSGGPKDASMLYTLGNLRDDVARVPGASFEEVVAWEGETQLDEGPGHQGAARVVRFVVRRRE